VTADTALQDQMDADAAAQAAQPPDLGALGDLTLLLQQRAEYLARKEELEQQLKQVNAALRELESKDIPELLLLAGVKKFTTTDGTEVSYGTAYYGRADTPEAIEWLNTHGHGGLVKHEFKVPIAASDAAAAKALNKYLAQAGYSFEEKEYVHSSTMKAWLKEQISAGAPLPTELFSVFTEYVTRVKNPKS
jgi:hypothetical protein